MAGDDKKSAPKASPKEKAPPKEKTAVEPKDKTAAAEAPVEAKTDAKAEAPKNYSRGEGQKPVSQAYKDNWDAIYGKKKKKR